MTETAFLKEMAEIINSAIECSNNGRLKRQVHLIVKPGQEYVGTAVATGAADRDELPRRRGSFLSSPSSLGPPLYRGGHRGGLRLLKNTQEPQVHKSRDPFPDSQLEKNKHEQ